MLKSNEAGDTFRQKLETYKPFHYEPTKLSLDPNYANYPGNVKFPRVMSNKRDCFHIPGTELKPEKKVIILSDWSLQTTAYEELRSKAIELLQHLVEADFEVKYWNGHKAVDISSADFINNESIAKVLANIKAISKKKLKTKLVATVQGDAICHLDYLKLRKVLADEALYKLELNKCLVVADLVPFEIIPRHILEWLKSQRFAITPHYHNSNENLSQSVSNDKSRCSELIVKTPMMFKRVLKLFADKIIGVEVFKWSSEDKNKIQKKYWFIFEELIHLTELETFTWHMGDAEWSSANIKNDENTSAVNLERFSKNMRHANALTHLKKFRFYSKMVPPKLLLTILEKASSSIQEFEIEVFDIKAARSGKKQALIFSDEATANLQWKSLKKLDLSNVLLSDSGFGAMLLNSKKLESVSLARCVVMQNETNTVDDAAFAEGLKYTKSIKLYGCELNQNTLLKMLANASGLEELHLFSVKAIANTGSIHETDAQDHKTLIYRNLDKIVVSDCEMDPLIISTMIKAAGSALTTLYLNDIQNPEKLLPHHIDDNINLINLIHLSVFLSEPVPEINKVIPLATYLKLVSLSPKVTSVGFGILGVKPIDGRSITIETSEANLDEVERYNLNHVLKLDLSYSSISDSALAVVLKRMQNIHTLKLNHCQNIKELTPENLNLPQLRYLDLSNTAIRGKAVAKLLKATPKLLKLNLENCGCVDDLTVEELRGIFDSTNTSLGTKFSYGNASLPVSTLFLIATCFQKTVNSENTSGVINANEINLNDRFNYKIDGNKIEILNQLRFQNVKKIEIEKLPSEFISALLNVTPNLEELKLEEIDFSTNIDVRLSSVKLTKIKMTACILSATKFSSLVSSASQLEAIDLSYCIVDVTVLPCEEFKNEKFPKLTAIKITYVRQCQLWLNNLIVNAPQLNTLTISGAFNKENDNFKPFSYNQNIKYLSLELATLSHDFVTAIFVAFPNLENLKIDRCYFEGSLSSLNVEDKNSEVPACIQMPYLKNVSITNTVIMGVREESFPKQIEAPQLETLDFQRSKITESILQMLVTLLKPKITNARIIDLPNSSSNQKSSSEKLTCSDAQTSPAAFPNASIGGSSPSFGVDTGMGSLSDTSGIPGISDMAQALGNMSAGQFNNDIGNNEAPSTSKNSNLKKEKETLAPQKVSNKTENHRASNIETPNKKTPAPLVEHFSSQSLLSEGKPGDKVTGTEYFIPSIHPSEYRLRIISEISFVNGNLVCHSHNDKKLIKINYERSKQSLRDKFRDEYLQRNDSGYALGEIELTLTRDWQALPSYLSSDELISAYSSEEAYEVKYSELENLYYIRSPHKSALEKAITINYIIRYDVEPQKKSKDKKSYEYQSNPDFPELDALVAHCENFHYDKNFSVRDGATTEEIFEARFNQQTGSCVGRSYVLQWKLQKLFKENSKYKKFKTRIVENDIHDFIEIFNGERWLKTNLGGYKAQAEINKLRPLADNSVAADPHQQDPHAVSTSDPGPSNSAVAAKTDEMISTTDAFNSVNSTKTDKVITEDDLEPAFIVWKPQSQLVPIPANQVFELIPAKGKQIVVQVENPNDCLQFIAEFSKNNQNQRAFFYIDNPDDLQWQASGFAFSEINNTNEPNSNEAPTLMPLKIKNQFTALRHFLQQHPNGILFVNLSRFTSTQVAAVHCIMDGERKLECEGLPIDLTIISLIVKNSENVHTGIDLTSRHQNTFPCIPQADVDLYHSRVEQTSHADDAAIVIDLFDSEDWEALLFGPIRIRTQLFSIAPSSFLNTLDNAPTQLSQLHLYNPPWHLREFQLFWQLALQTGEFTLYGKTFKLSEEFKLSHSQNLVFDTECLIEDLNDNKPQIDQIFPLNMQTFNQLFEHYVYCDGGFKNFLGLFARHSNETICLQVTENISRAQWSRLLTEANKHHIKLQIVADLLAIQIPTDIPKEKYSSLQKMLFKNNLLKDDFSALLKEPVSVVVSNAPQKVADLLLDTMNNAMMIELDDTHDFGDLFYRILPRLMDEKIIAEFIESDPWKNLQSGKTVILYGNLSKVLENALAPLLIAGKPVLMVEGKPIEFTGHLILVTDNHKIPADTVFECNESSLEEKFPQFNYFSRKDRSSKFVTAQTDPVVQPNIPAVIDQQPTSSTDLLSLEHSEAFKQRRFAAIQNGFECSPIIFYTGPTGIGKTTYLLKHFEDEYYAKTGRKAKLYIGEDSLADFAKHADQDIDPFYFVDEANLSSQKLSIIKGLCSHKKHQLHEGCYYDFSSEDSNKNSIQHRVLLAGNDEKYGGVRQQGKFLREYAKTVVCEPTHPAFLYHEVLKPILHRHTSQEKISRIILDFYDRVNSMGSQSDQQLLSQRHLHMMAVLFDAYKQQFSNINVTDTYLAIAACMTIMGDTLPEKKLITLQKYCIHQYGYDPVYFATLQRQIIQEKLAGCNRINQFTFTRSRYGILQILDILLSTCERDDFHFGLLLEGASGIGKSGLDTNYLNKIGIPHIQFSFSSNFENDRKTLLDAFNKGLKVIIDEINAGGPRHEKLLNTLIMGTDEKGNKAYKKGFMVIATQNPMDHAGREPLSPALRARFIKLNVPEYAADEFIEILEGYGVVGENAQVWVSQFLLACAYADFHHLSPKPNLRHLLPAAGVDLSVDSQHPAISQQVLETPKPARELPPSLHLSSMNMTSAAKILQMLTAQKATHVDSPEAATLLTITPGYESDDDEEEVISISSIIIDQLLIDDVNEQLQKLKNRKSKSDSAARGYLEKLKELYLQGKLVSTSPSSIANESEFKHQLSRSSARNNIKRLADRFSKACSANENVMNINNNYKMDDDFILKIQGRIEKLHQQISNPSTLEFHADRRWQKYIVLRKMLALYQHQQLTEDHIRRLESDHKKIYYGFFSHHTRNLVRELRKNIVVENAKSILQKNTKN